MNVPNGWRRTDVKVSVVLVAATLVALTLFLNKPDDEGLQRLIVGAWVGWALLPPAYFLIEWSRFTGDMDDDFARLRYNHELASKFWLAGVGVLSAVLLKYSGAMPAAGP